MLNVFIRMKHFGLSVFQKLNDSLKPDFLPEILGKYYSQPNSSLIQVTDSTQPSN